MKNHIQLDIQDNEAILSYLSDKIILPIGIKNFNGFTFQHASITAYEAEMAIEHIENAIIPIKKQLPTGEILLFSHDNKLNLLIESRHINGNFITTSQIEDAFNELVDVINGSPIHSTQLPTNSEFSAFLLIIREITHHWSLHGITYN
ncbi:hypothetical protein [Providencia rettgeri]|uniref:hypothetical protein n=1 Tax=Providencia rettgeri TaxID=587 RepID=UPI001BAD1AB0|nr:hypothetical protein [Providencia rettgeri]MBS0858829.1 hypothetical protein [Providencia rettgeri]MBS0872567.1 hypothetical protein [Providencia rettgeri]MBS0919713.1 hypothetical protein [Providencia rettgeri]